MKNLLFCLSCLALTAYCCYAEKPGEFMQQKDSTGVIGLFSEALPRKFYFPECQVQIPSPQGWYARNKTQANVGMVFVSKEEVIGMEGKFLTGLSFFSNYEKVMKIEIPDTNYFAEALFHHGILKILPKEVKKSFYELETQLGNFKFMEIIEGRKPIVARGVLKSDKGAFLVIIEAPVDEWKSVKPILLEMAKNIRLLSSGQENDEIVYSVQDNPLSKLYDQRDYRKKKSLIEKFKMLKKGMSVKEYFEIMDYKLREVQSNEGNKKNLVNETPGWIKSIHLALTPNKFDIIDIYGVYNGCICEELFYARIEDKRITDLNLINHMLPDDFNVGEWENFLVGPMINPEQAKMKIEKINTWATEKYRTIKAFENIKNINTGISEMEYLNMAQSFNIQFILHILPVIPGVFDCQVTNLPYQGIKREYVYAFRENGKIVTVGKVIILGGKVTSITVENEDENEKSQKTGTSDDVKLFNPDRSSDAEKSPAKKKPDNEMPSGEVIKSPLDKKPRLIKSPNPEYPEEALKANVQGNVIIEAVTDIYGQVVSAKAIEGPEMLMSAAVEAIKKWRYEPYMMDGVPRPVKFKVAVKFSLGNKKNPIICH